MSLLVAQKVGDVVVFVFQTTSILDEVAVNEVARELEHVVQNSEVDKFVIDMGRIEMMTSSMLGQLVKFKKLCDTEQFSLMLCNLSGEIQKLFKMTRLDKVFSIAKTREAALKKV